MKIFVDYDDELEFIKWASVILSINQAEPDIAIDRALKLRDELKQRSINNELLKKNH